MRARAIGYGKQFHKMLVDPCAKVAMVVLMATAHAFVITTRRSETWKNREPVKCHCAPESPIGVAFWSRPTPRRLRWVAMRASRRLKRACPAAIDKESTTAGHVW